MSLSDHLLFPCHARTLDLAGSKIVSVGIVISNAVVLLDGILTLRGHGGGKEGGGQEQQGKGQALNGHCVNERQRGRLVGRESCAGKGERKVSIPGK